MLTHNFINKHKEHAYIYLYVHACRRGGRDRAGGTAGYGGVSRGGDVPDALRALEGTSGSGEAARRREAKTGAAGGIMCVYACMCWENRIYLSCVLPCLPALCLMLPVVLCAIGSQQVMMNKH
jgi:hypothetical protein